MSANLAIVDTRIHDTIVEQIVGGEEIQTALLTR
jgi:hypothetical protein